MEKTPAETTAVSAGNVPRDSIPCITNVSADTRGRTRPSRPATVPQRRPARIGHFRRRSASLSFLDWPDDSVTEGVRTTSASVAASAARFDEIRRRRQSINDEMKERTLEDALAVELVNETFRCSVTSDARKDLQKLVRRVSGTVLRLSWPNGWFFTYCDLLRVGYFGHLNIKGLEKTFLCCDKFLLPVGTVSRCEAIGRPPLPVLIGEGGRVYVYSPVVESLYLVSRSGFRGFVQEGLRNYAPLREELGYVRFETGGDVGREFMLARDLLALWRLCMKREGSIFSWRDGNEALTTVVLNGSQTYEDPAHGNWLKETCSLNVLQVFVVRAVPVESQQRLDISILVNESGAVFGVHPDTRQAHFLARGLLGFFRVGFLRFCNNYCFARDCFTHPESVAPAYRATGCPRELFCRRLRKKKGLFARR
ncbi:tegument protein UL43 [Human betaherpesvirus 5]|uniref:Tegument protein UL43 n=2 Tax=Human cytomegalovirus TaxID=10359 RepID=UL43_HCMVM|nr:tegument protein UL43 [Human betaherpesvirus 5]Q6SW89.1 RecName: Full=Tegument protein UL43 [Human herpesvirus 5 strain Merlin]AVT50301.1 tegument protein UL43 [synthetic human betaherpesvirus 5]WNA12911.1 tegument protein UL43 [Cytomegalovirus humanbeta5]AAR31607.1 tegument protein UL43 [Human betaherpesvirus 5]ACZ72796.1 tegument protein UL43 [Human betaherpesvirus 5]AII79487.1 tegument protein UL43 [Human betaherpesvirus 5]